MGIRRKSGLLAGIATAVLALQAATPAQAAAWSEALLGPLQLAVYDLNPADGLDPWVSVHGSGTLQASVWGEGMADPGDHWAWQGRSFRPVQVYAYSGESNADAWVISDGKLASSVVYAGGEVTNPVVADASVQDVNRYHALAAPAGDETWLTVGPNTAVVLRGSYQLAGEVWGGAAQGWSPDMADASAWLALSGPGVDGTGQQGSFDRVGFQIASPVLGQDALGLVYGDDWRFMRGRLTASYVNFGSGGASDARFELGTAANGLAHGMTEAQLLQVSSVPEPGGWAMLLAGLGVLALRLRREARG